ncbi:MAG: hypothetical protein V4585_15210 [Bacteroidota bacterium]|jgi:hypothetical protein
MDKFIRNNFLAICITLSVIFAFAKKATILQQDEPRTTQPVVQNSNQEVNATFKRYWEMQGTEISQFVLQQDSINLGDVTLSFSLENFEKQAPQESIQMLTTTINHKSTDYKYSMTTLSFVPLNLLLRPHAQEVSSSIQEMKGTELLKLQIAPKSYAVTIEGNLIKKGEEHIALSKTNIEDEIWAKIRLNPEALPKGEIEIIPSLSYWNTIHKIPEVLSATAELKGYEGREFIGKKLKIYSLNYPDLKRNLSIIFEGDFPFQIVGWQEENEGKVVIGRRK